MSKIQNLKAIHNEGISLERFEKLFQYVKDTKFESNSQRHFFENMAQLGCFNMSKIQNLKAIHNADLELNNPFSLFQYVKDTKFESNSQHKRIYDAFDYCCFNMSKIQNLKAIHNK